MLGRERDVIGLDGKFIHLVTLTSHFINPVTGLIISMRHIHIISGPLR